jgi:large subunit ribosomal protein L18
MLKKDRITRKRRIRPHVLGTAERPRLSVYRSNKFMYAQLIDDTKGVTLAEAHGKTAEQVGAAIAEKAQSNKITKVVFDRNGFLYHGRVERLADVARAGGLIF